MAKQRLAHLAHPSNERRSVYTQQWRTQCNIFASIFRVESIAFTHLWPVCPKCAAAQLLQEITEAAHA